MIKYKKVIIIAAVLLVVVGLAILLSKLGSAELIEPLNYRQYQEMIKLKRDIYVYTGDDEEELKVLTSMAKENPNLKIYRLDMEKLTEEEIKSIKGTNESNFSVYNNNKKVYEYTGSYEDNAYREDFINAGILPKSLISVNVNEFMKIVKEDEYNFMVAGSTGCGYCDQFKGTINEALKEYKFNVYYIDLYYLSDNDVNKLITAYPGMFPEGWGTPTSALFKNGKLIKYVSGALPYNEFIKILKDNKVIK